MKTLYTILILFFIAACNDKTPENEHLQNKMSGALSLFNLSYSGAELDSAIENVEGFLNSYKKFHEATLYNETPFPLIFNPLPSGWEPEEIESVPIRWQLPKEISLPENKDDLAWYTVAELSILIKTGKISSEALTGFFIERLKKHGPQLECVITIMEDEALKKARKADEDLKNGNYKGPLHGIPYGLKDLFAVEGTKTSWGAAPYKDQMIDLTATVVEKLEVAGAIPIAKLTLGALAWGDVWYGGMTRNPWDLSQGASGSSAGSAAGVAAGLLPFALGTETYGSIVSPSTRCGTTGLRPTFGRVSRFGAMALCWSLDKIGPITRDVQDAAMVFEAIHGPDNLDKTVYELPFNFLPKKDLRGYKIGYFHTIDSARASDFDKAVIETLRNLGARPEPVNFEFPLSSDIMTLTLYSEAAAAFDELTRSGVDNLLVRQVKNAWPNVFRSARLIPAVEYINAQRHRHTLMEDFNDWIIEYDVIICPTFAGNMLGITNLTGHPSVVLPTGFNEDGHPVSITFIGNLFDEGKILEVAFAFQQATDHHLRHPQGF